MRNQDGFQVNHKEEGRGSYHHGERGHGGHHHGGSYITERLEADPELQILFVGSLNCIRHKPFGGMGELMQKGKMSFLCPTMSDFAAGRYLREVVNAVVELAAERNAKHFLIIFGCQWVILSTNEAMLAEELRGHGIEAEFYDDSHLEHGDHA